MTKAMIYLYVTPSGSVNLIEGDKMPVKPEKEDFEYELPFAKAIKKYERLIEAAKASSVPVDDQDAAWRLIFQEPQMQNMISFKYNSADRCVSYREGNQHYSRTVPQDIYGPFNIEYRIERKKCEGCGVSDDADCKKSPGHCEYLLEDVAILLPETKKVNEDFLGTPQYDDDPPIKRNVEPVGKLQEKEEQDALWAKVADHIRNLRHNGHDEDSIFKYLKERFTITRKHPF